MIKKREKHGFSLKLFKTKLDKKWYHKDTGQNNGALIKHLDFWLKNENSI